MTQDMMPDQPAQGDDLMDLSQDKLLSLYAIELVEAKGVAEEDKLAEVNRVKSDLEDVINAAIIDHLPIEKVNELSTKFTQNEITPEIMDQAVIDAGVDVEKVTEEALNDYRDGYLAASGDAATTLEQNVTDGAEEENNVQPAMAGEEA